MGQTKESEEKGISKPSQAKEGFWLVERSLYACYDAKRQYKARRENGIHETSGRKGIDQTEPRKLAWRGTQAIVPGEFCQSQVQLTPPPCQLLVYRWPSGRTATVPEFGARGFLDTCSAGSRGMLLEGLVERILKFPVSARGPWGGPSEPLLGPLASWVPAAA